MITIKRTSNDEVVAEYYPHLGEWKILEDELQRRMETGMIEGVLILGGDGPKHAEGGDVVGDTTTVLMPGESGFEDAYWDEVLDDDYRMSWGEEDAMESARR